MSPATILANIIVMQEVLAQVFSASSKQKWKYSENIKTGIHSLIGGQMGFKQLFNMIHEVFLYKCRQTVPSKGIVHRVGRCKCLHGC